MNTPKAAPVVVEAAEREKFEAWYARTYWLNEDDEERARAFKDPSWTRLIEDAWVVWWARATLARPAEVAQVVGMPSNVREFVSDVADDTMLNNELRAWAHRLIAEDDAATRAPVAVGVEPADEIYEDPLCDCGQSQYLPHSCAYQNGHDIYAKSATPQVEAVKDSVQSVDGRDAERYRWLRDKSQDRDSFYLSVPKYLHGVRFTRKTVDDAIDAAILSTSAVSGGSGS